MAKIPGTIPLGGTIAPTDSEDVYATHIANYGLGGLHHVDTIAERNAITAERRVEGMLCTVMDDGNGDPKIYQLVGGLDNANWQALASGSGGSGAPGAPGKDGVDGKDGADGKSAYEVAVDNGYTGTEQEWLASLKGVPGADGSDHGEPDVIVAAAASVTYPKGSETKVKLAIINSRSGTGLELDNNDVVCKRDGHVLIIGRASTTPPSGNTAAQGYSRLYLYMTPPGGTATYAGGEARVAPAASNAIYNEICRLMAVSAGTRLHLNLYPDLARSGGVQMNVSYLSANGLSAYEVAVKNGFQGTEPEWIDGIEKVLVAEPSYDWQHTVTQDYTQSTVGNVTYLEGTASVDGMLCGQFSSNMASVAAGAGLLLDIDGVRVARRAIVGAGSGNCLSVPITKGQTFKFGIAEANWIGTFLSTAYGPGTGIFIAPVKASNALLKTYNTTEADTGQTWIDGKRIYRRVVQGTTNVPLSGVYTQCATIDARIAAFVNLRVWLEIQPGDYIPIPYTTVVSGVASFIAAYARYENNNGVIYIANQISSYKDRTFYAVVEYTKA